jgi:hypothetical protein
VSSLSLSPSTNAHYPRVIEGVLEKMIEWASAALETSSNQPILPYAIIVLNAAEEETLPELWDAETSTTSIFKSLAETGEFDCRLQVCDDSE